MFPTEILFPVIEHLYPNEAKVMYNVSQWVRERMIQLSRRRTQEWRLEADIPDMKYVFKNCKDYDDMYCAAMRHYSSRILHFMLVDKSIPLGYRVGPKWSDMRWIMENVQFALQNYRAGHLRDCKLLVALDAWLQNPEEALQKRIVDQDLEVMVVMCLPQSHLLRLMETPRGQALIAKAVTVMRQGDFYRRPYFEYLNGYHRRMINGG